MFRMWKFLLITVVIGQPLQSEEPHTDEKLQGKFLAVAQCEAINEHMCPLGLCTVVAAVNQTNERDDSWTPAQHFCDAYRDLKDGRRTVCNCAKRLGKIKTIPCEFTGNLTKVFPFDFCLQAESKQRRLSVPTLHCREPTFISIKWNYSMDSTQVISIVFAVEIHIHGDPNWKPYSLTRKNIAVVEGLVPRQIYRFRVSAVNSSGVIEISTSSESISTLPLASDFQSQGLALDPPLSVEQIGPIEYTDESATVRFGWKPGQDATCTYRIINTVVSAGNKATMPPDPRDYNFAEAPMELEIKDLSLDHTYLIYVKSLIGQYDEKVVESKTGVVMGPLFIKDCLSVFNHNLTICRPPKPEKLNVAIVETSNNTVQVTISWTHVKGHPTGYNVSLYDADFGVIDTRLVPGTDKVAIFDNIPLEKRYHAKVSAYSPAGHSDPALKLEKVKFSGNSKYKGTSPVTQPVTESTPTSNSPTERNGGPTVSVKRAEPSDHHGIYLSVGGVVVVVATVVVSLLRVLLTRMQRKPRTPGPGEHDQRDFESVLPESPELEASDLHLSEQIGEGAFGTVWLGLLSKPLSKGPIRVAVKMLRENPSAEDCRHFDNEMSILRSVKPHRNVVRFIKCVTQTPENKILMEYCEFGDLQTFLNKNWKDFIEEPSENLNSSNGIDSTADALKPKMYQNCLALANNTYGVMLGADRKEFAAELISFMRQVASGMEFLTESGILHRDLAARNVLVAGDRSIRISDFGLSREVLETSVYRKLGCERVAVKWIAPEAFESRVFTTKCDVWSYGIVLWEIVTLGGSPYSSVDNVLEFLRRGERLPRPCNCSQDLYEWMRRCWEKKPEDRPTFQLLREHMENLELSGDQHISLDNDKISTFKFIRPTEVEGRD